MHANSLQLRRATLTQSETADNCVANSGILYSMSLHISTELRYK